MDRKRQTPWLPRLLGLLLGLSLFVLLLALPAPQGWTPSAWRILAVIALMVCWWISEAIPVYATALAPLALFPPLGIAPISDAAAPYAHPLIFLFLGGFLIAEAMQRWSLHRRIALNLLRVTGVRTHGLIGGFMIAAGFLSMWISNTATAVMMLPIALSVVALAEEASNGGEGLERFETALFLSVAYACSLGGLATLIGTPPNAILAATMERDFGMEITFAGWMSFGLPLSLLLLLLGWLLLTRVVFRLPNQAIEGVAQLVGAARRDLGPMGRGEALALFGFLLAATLWILQGWLEAWLPLLGLSDAGIAIAVALLLFALPVKPREGIFVLNWDSARRLPWGVLLLFGGGLSLAQGINDSGLADILGALLGKGAGLPFWAIALIAVAGIVFLTEVMSNTATAAAFLPIASALALEMGEAPLALAAPVALGASCAFMLPTATPPNAVVFGSGRIGIPQMARAGLLFNLMAIAVILLLAAPLASWLLVR